MLLFCRRFFLFFVLNILQLTVHANDSSAIRFYYTVDRVNDQQAQVVIHAKLSRGIELFAQESTQNNVLYSNFSFDSSSVKFLQSEVRALTVPHQIYDSSVQANVYYFKDSAQWIQSVNVSPSDSLTLKLSFTYLYKKEQEYIPGETILKIRIKPSADLAENEMGLRKQSLWLIFLAAFAGGLLALLTPCVYSMIPVTVSFFTKRSHSKKEGIRNAIYYAASIVLIFTVLGFLITLIFGPAALNNLATNWIANLIFFALFLVFGFSFLGAFEISLPSSWTNRSDSKANVSSFAGIFFMALTLVLVSFSCTGPIIGNLLVLASKGNYFGPLVGMLGFSTALALPFALFAFFPSKLNVLGKAGGWLNSVKVTLGFLELALALKFFSNADLVKGWRILDREVFIVFWVVIFVLLGIYLLGKIKFHHDDELPKNSFGLPYLTVTRLLFAITAFAFALYMIPGLFGAPLKSISAFVPPMGTQDFTTHPEGEGESSLLTPPEGGGKSHPKKYYEQMKMYEPEVVTRYGLITYFDYDEALAAARKFKKPLMLDFTGINCVNCRKMEGQVWSDPEVMRILKEDFIIVSLYVDVQNVELPEQEIYFSKALNQQVETLGDKNADMQVTTFGANSQPYYFFLDANEKRLVPDGYGYDPNIQRFKQLLTTVTEKYKALDL
jgi:thiol:disulfide interchange protein